MIKPGPAAASLPSRAVRLSSTRPVCTASTPHPRQAEPRSVRPDVGDPSRSVLRPDLKHGPDQHKRQAVGEGLTRQTPARDQPVGGYARQCSTLAQQRMEQIPGAGA